MFRRLRETLSGTSNRLQGRTDLLEGICAGVALVAAADGTISDKEVDEALERIVKHPVVGAAFPPSKIESVMSKQLANAKLGRTGAAALRREIEEAAAKSTEGDRQDILYIAIDTAAAPNEDGSPGEIGTAEMTALERIAGLLSLNLKDHL